MNARRGGNSSRAKDEERRHRQNLAAAWASVLIAAVGIVIGTWLAVSRLASSGDHSGDAGSETKPAGPTLAVATHWPTFEDCDGATSVAMPAGTGPLSSFHSSDDVRTTLIGAGGGSWEGGYLTLHLSVRGAGSVEVSDLKPHILRSDLPAPAWVYEPEGGCGGTMDRVFKLKLDNPASLSDEGVVDESGGMLGPDAEVRSADLGPAFVLSGDKHARLRIDAVSCLGNYEWTLGVDYVATGDSKTRTVTLGPFTSYGIGQATSIISGYQDATGAVTVGQQRTFSGIDVGCADRYGG